MSFSTLHKITFYKLCKAGSESAINECVSTALASTDPALILFKSRDFLTAWPVCIYLS